MLDREQDKSVVVRLQQRFGSSIRLGCCRGLRRGLWAGLGVDGGGRSWRHVGLTVGRCLGFGFWPEFGGKPFPFGSNDDHRKSSRIIIFFYWRRSVFLTIFADYRGNFVTKSDLRSPSMSFGQTTRVIQEFGRRSMGRICEIIFDRFNFARICFITITRESSPFCFRGNPKQSHSQQTHPPPRNLGNNSKNRGTYT